MCIYALHNSFSELGSHRWQKHYICALACRFLLEGQRDGQGPQTLSRPSKLGQNRLKDRQQFLKNSTSVKPDFWRWFLTISTVFGCTEMHFIEQKHDSYLTVPLVFAKHDETEICQRFTAEATKRSEQRRQLLFVTQDPKEMSIFHPSSMENCRLDFDTRDKFTVAVVASKIASLLFTASREAAKWTNHKHPPRISRQLWY